MGPIAVVSVGRAAEVDREAEVNCVVKSKTSTTLKSTPLPPSLQRCIINIIDPPLHIVLASDPPLLQGLGLGLRLRLGLGLVLRFLLCLLIFLGLGLSLCLSLGLRLGLDRKMTYK